MQLLLDTEKIMITKNLIKISIEIYMKKFEFAKDLIQKVLILGYGNITKT